MSLLKVKNCYGKLFAVGGLNPGEKNGVCYVPRLQICNCLLFGEKKLPEIEENKNLKLIHSRCPDDAARNCSGPGQCGPDHHRAKY